MSLQTIIEEKRKEFEENFTHKETCASLSSDLSPCYCGRDEVEQFIFSNLIPAVLDGLKTELIQERENAKMDIPIAGAHNETSRERQERENAQAYIDGLNIGVKLLSESLSDIKK